VEGYKHTPGRRLAVGGQLQKCLFVKERIHVKATQEITWYVGGREGGGQSHPHERGGKGSV